MKLLHIVNDDKFMDDAIELFDSIGVHNVYVFIQHSNENLRYIKNKGRIIVCSYNEATKFLTDDSVAYCVFHSLPVEYYSLILQIPQNKKIIWISWGFDLYGGADSLLNIELYKPYTKKMLGIIMNRSLSQCFKYFAKDIKNKFISKFILRKEKKNLLWDEVAPIYRRIDYLSTVLPIEFEVIKKLHRDLHFTYFPFQYCSKNREKIKEVYSSSGSVKKILLGNSAAPTNNHADIIYLLRKRQIYNPVVLPLSYGGTKKYIESIKNFISHSSQFLLQETLMPIEQYISLISECSVAIFGSIRQQALGNIQMCFLQGMKLFFFEQSMCYKYFKNEGYIIFSIEKDLSSASVQTPLSNEDKEHNIRLITSMLAFNSVSSRLNGFFYNE